MKTLSASISLLTRSRFSLFFELSSLHLELARRNVNFVDAGYIDQLIEIIFADAQLSKIRFSIPETTNNPVLSD
jgi:hypothetical protein